MKAATVSVMDALRDVELKVEVKVTGLRWVRTRIACGEALIRLAGWVIGCGVKIDKKREATPLRKIAMAHEVYEALRRMFVGLPQEGVSRFELTVKPDEAPLLKVWMYASFETHDAGLEVKTFRVSEEVGE